MKADAELMSLHRLGLRLGKTIGELGDMTYGEYVDWIAFFELTSRE